MKYLRDIDTPCPLLTDSFVHIFWASARNLMHKKINWQESAFAFATAFAKSRQEATAWNRINCFALLSGTGVVAVWCVLLKHFSLKFGKQCTVDWNPNDRFKVKNWHETTAECLFWSKLLLGTFWIKKSFFKKIQIFKRFQIFRNLG